MARILSPIVRNTVCTVKNSSHFAELVRGETLNSDQILVSFDVVFLFTKIPVDLTVKIVEKRLTEDVSLSQRTSLPVDDIINQLSFCL